MKERDLVERMESTRFLGRDFLVYLWWKSETHEGELEIEGYGRANVNLETTIVLECKKDELEKSSMRGPAPSATKEAKEALRAGKLPSRAQLRIVHEEQEFAFAFKADTFSTSGVKLPALLTDDEDETLFERMHLVEKLEGMLLALYREFLRARLSPKWRAKIAPAIRAWVQTD